MPVTPYAEAAAGEGIDLVVELTFEDTGAAESAAGDFGKRLLRLLLRPEQRLFCLVTRALRSACGCNWTFESTVS